MRVGGSLFLIALGAILKFAVHIQNTHGFNVGTAGVILMVIGAIGLVITAIMMSTRQRTDIVQQGGVGTSRTTYVEPRGTVEPF